MKTTMKILPLMLGIMLFFTQCEKEAEINAEAFMDLKVEDADCYVEQDLWAGAGQNNTDNGELVGKVIASITGGILTVEYVVDEPWYATEYHLWVGKEITDIPRNAAPGRFPYSGSASYTIDLDELGFEPGDVIYIASHAVVANDEEGSADYGALELPESVEFELLSFPGTVSYFDLKIEDGGILTGEHDSWCIDPSLPIGPNASTTHPFYQADVYLSLDLPLDYNYYEMDFGKVNWILNFAAPQVPDNYSFGDVQTAIWRVLFGESYTVIGAAPGFTEANVAEIVDAAQSDFIPGCNQFVGIILHTDDELQPIIIPFPVPCMGAEETAWAFGDETFIDNGISRKWGWIFDIEYCVAED